MEKIVTVIPLDDHQLQIETSSGLCGIFDVKPYLVGSAFQELRHEAYFRLVRPSLYGISWPNEQDFSSDTIIWDMMQGDITQSPEVPAEQPSPV